MEQFHHKLAIVFVLENHGSPRLERKENNMMHIVTHLSLENANQGHV